MHKENNNDNNVLESTYNELAIFENFFSTQWKNIIIFGSVLVLLIGIGMWIKTWSSAQNATVAGELCSATTIEEIEIVLKKYPGHKSADYTRLRLGALYFENANHQKAIEIFAKLAEKARFNDVKAQAALNEACVLEQMGKDDVAAEKYASIGRTSNYPIEYRADANCSAARIFISRGKKAMAKSCIDLIDPNALEGGMRNPHYQRAQLLSPSLRE